YAEVAHEAIFRRWGKLQEWITKEREFLIWKSTLEASQRAYAAAPADAKADAVLMGLPLTQASNWLAKRAGDIPAAHRDFIALSGKAALRRRQRTQALAGGLAIVIVVGLGAWWQERWLNEYYFWFAHMRGQGLTAERERALKPGETFWECAKTDTDVS